MKKQFFLILFALVSVQVFAQTNVEFEKENFKDNKDGLREAKKNLELGDDIFTPSKYNLDEEYRKAFYKSAIDPYLKANTFNPNNALLNYKLGVCYLYSSFKVKAIPFLEKAQKLNPAVTPDVSFYLGRAYHLNAEWQKGISAYKMYLSSLKVDKEKDKIAMVNKLISECITGEELAKKPVRVFIDNIGPEVNSQYPEYGCVTSADESVMIFTSRRPNTTGGAQDMEENMYMEDLYITTRKNGRWTPAVNMGTNINSEKHDATVCLSPDGQKLIIYRDDNKGDLYECMLKGDQWSKPERMSKNINTDYHESSASYSFDGKTLYFVSDKPDGMGDRDIYFSTLDEKGRWGKPQNMGPMINTQWGEEGVFMMPDGKTMYFSSQGHNTMGGYDIFKTVFENGKWSEPENLGWPINTPDDDVFLVLSASGRHGYYASFKNNNDGYGEKDIYRITFLGPEKPVVVSGEDNLLASITAPVKETVIAPTVEIKVAQITLLKGVITDALTQKPLEAQIDLIDNTKNEVLATFTSNSSTGKYLVSLPAGKNYGIAVKKEGYLFHSENFDIPASAAFQEVVKDVQLKNVAVGSKIVLKNIFFDFGKATLRPESTNELERLVALLNDVPSLKIEISGHTDNKSSAEFNQKLSEARAKAVVDYLVSKGISKDRLTAVGYGLTQPIASNDTEEGRQMNRRTEFKILGK